MLSTPAFRKNVRESIHQAPVLERAPARLRMTSLEPIVTFYMPAADGGEDQHPAVLARTEWRAADGRLSPRTL